MSKPVSDERRRLAIDGDDDLAALVALSGLPGQSPNRLWALLDLAPPRVVWHRVGQGQIPASGRSNDPSASWAAHAASVQPNELLARHRERGIEVQGYGTAGYPERLLDDPDPPAVLFTKGQGSTLDRAAVAVVGTRRCSRYGSEVARDLGAALASAGIDVVSGLARGIDAAAHAGAVQAAANHCVAVVASGADVVYPRGNRNLWMTVAERGRLVTEWPLGSPALPWRFPARNRVIAGLSVTVVVVETLERGGSLYTVDEAVARDRPVFAVPGSMRSPVSAGAHRLIADGAQILCSIEDLVDALAPSKHAGAASTTGGGASSDAEPVSWLLELIGWEPMSVDAVVAATSRSPLDVNVEVERMIAAGLVVRTGALVERVR